MRNAPDSPASLTSPTLVVLAAGLGARYGGLKQLTPVGPHGEALVDYGVYDAARAGFRKVVVVIRPDVEERFRRHVAGMISAGVEVAYAHQVLEPAPPGRSKPWGTGHAVLAAAPRAGGGPFAVMNADDFYGGEVFQQLLAHLTTADEHALIAYPLEQTLSPHGGVSRAIAESDARGYLRRLTEVVDIARRDSGLTGRTTGGETVKLAGGELVSMNLWGFTPAVLPALERQFAGFLERRGTDAAAEFLLSDAIGAQVAAGQARVRVVLAHAGTQWFGVTFAADDDGVRKALRRLVDAGVYPGDLRTGFERLPRG